MDILAHALWTGAIFKSLKYRAKLWKPIVWGVLPDVFSFGLLTAWMLLSLIFGGTALDFQHFEAMEPAQRDAIPIFQIVSFMYNFTHSLFVFAAFFIVFYFLFRKPLWAMLGWATHILIDIPTHSYKFYPTPFLWPVSSWKFNGISWGNKWFMMANYSALIIFYAVLFIVLRKYSKKK